MSIRTTLGNDFIAPEEIMEAYPRVFYTKKQLARFVTTTPPQEVLNFCRSNGYVIIAGPDAPFSLNDIQTLNPDYFYAKKGGLYAEQDFAQDDTAETRWIMLRKEPVPGSRTKHWNEQRVLLLPEEVSPNVAEVAWCVSVYKTIRGISLLQDSSVRTGSVDWEGYPVTIGNFDEKGLRICNWSTNPIIGIASALK